jgi:hypothetical protein
MGRTFEQCCFDYGMTIDWLWFELLLPVAVAEAPPPGAAAAAADEELLLALLLVTTIGWFDVATGTGITCGKPPKPVPSDGKPVPIGDSEPNGLNPVKPVVVGSVDAAKQVAGSSRPSAKPHSLSIELPCRRLFNAPSWRS